MLPTLKVLSPAPLALVALRVLLAAAILTGATHGTLSGARAALTPLTAADHVAIDALYQRTLHEEGVRTGVRHWLTNFFAEPVPGGAEAWSYIVRSTGAEMTIATLYRDRLVKRGGHWRIEKHEEFPGTVMPPREHLLPPSNVGEKTLTARDIFEMKRLITRYNLGYDNAAPFDGGVLSSLSFTVDALFERPGGATRVGRAGAIVQAKEFQSKTGLHHWDTNYLFDVAPDGEVTSINYDMQFNVADGGSPVKLNGAGLLFHKFIRTPEGWLMKYRRYDAPATVKPMKWPAPGYGMTARELSARAAAKGRLSEADRVEIEQLYARASFAFDAGLAHGADFARTFTPDGVLVRHGTTTSGQAALTAVAADAEANPVLHHWLTNLTIEPSPEGAIGRVYVLNFMPGNAATAVRDVGHFDDRLVRTNEGWRFARRAYTSALPVAR